jgi:hypothetical protein
MTPRVAKRADFGSDGQSRSFESAFGQIAHDYLQDRSPALLDYEVGFQLLDRDDDKNRSFGVTAFKVGPMWLYAPVFYVNGKLKGEELLYIKDKDMFCPLDDAWVDMLLRKIPTQVGQATPFNTYAQGVRPPDLHDIGMSPRKFASALPAFAPWAVDAVDRFVTIATGAATPPQDLLGFIGQCGVKAASAWHALLTEYPPLRAGFDRLYPVKAVQAAITKAASRPERPARRGPIRPRRLVLDGPPAQAKVAVYRPEDRRPIGLDDTDREAMLRDGLVIKDARDESETSKAFAVPVLEDLDRTLRSPDTAGLYAILDRDGRTVKCLVFPAPVNDSGVSGLLVIPIEGGKERDWTVAHPTRVYAATQYPDAEFRAEIEKLPKMGDPDSGTLIVAIDPTTPGAPVASLPFEVGTRRGDRDGVSTRDAYFRTCCLDTKPAFGRGGKWPLGHVSGDQPSADFRSKRVRLGLPEGSAFEFQDATLRVPETARRLTLSRRALEDMDSDRFELGDKAEVLLGIRKAGAVIEVAGAASERAINQQRVGSDRDALTALVLGHGLGESEARGLLDIATKEARHGRGARFLIKYADGYPRFGDEALAPAFPEPHYSNGSALHPDRQTLPFQERSVPVESLRTRSDAAERYRPMTDPPEPDQGMLRAAARASEEGDREFFDVAGLQSLLRVVSTDDLLDDDLDTVTRGMDAMGRQLLKMYFHDEQYIDRYGSAGAKELEDAFRNTFEATGKLVIAARQQTIEPMPEEAARSADLGSVANQ